MLYCAVGLVDDVQDEDAGDYLQIPVCAQINVALSLREMALVRAGRIVGDFAFAAISRSVAEATVRMAASQAEDLARPTVSWDEAAFLRVARGAAGAEMGLLLYVTGTLCGVFSVGFRAVGEALGVKFQIDQDLRSRDRRISWAEVADVERMRKSILAELDEALGKCPPDVVELLRAAAGEG
jgi:hypothetical protein